MFYFLLSFIMIPLGYAQDSSVMLKPCPQVEIRAEKGDLEFTPSEMIFICGAKDTQEWKKIPPYQVKFHLRGILQSRGYLDPQFNEKEGKLIVDVGEISRIQEVEIKGSPIPIDVTRDWKIFDTPLTPKNVDNLKEWIADQLENSGYPCPVIEMVPQIEKNGVVAQVTPHQYHLITEVSRESVPGVRDEVPSRFDAFTMGSEFSENRLRLTEQRIVRQNFAQSAHFEVVCKGDEFKLNEKFVPGKPRIFRIGIGVNTEEGPLFRTSWEHSRLGTNASTVGALLKASLIQQYFQVNSKIYYYPQWVRHYLKPELTVRRETEEHYRIVSSELNLYLGYQHDNNFFRVGFETGPSGNYDFIFEEAGSESENRRVLGYMAWKTNIEIMSHEYERNFANPYEGYFINFIQETVQDILASPFSAYRFGLEVKYLVNIASFSPAKYVLGLRTGWFTTVAPDDMSDDPISILPPDMKNYLGGLSDLRGFGRKELPLTGLGALTTGAVGVELRFPNQLPLTLEPYFFTDAGVLGEDRGSVRMPVYLSPGLGIAAHPPFGILNLSVSHGYLAGERNGIVDDQAEHLQVYFSFGREF